MDGYRVIAAGAGVEQMKGYRVMAASAGFE